MNTMYLTHLSVLLEYPTLRSLLPGASLEDLEDAQAHLRRELTRRDVAACETWQEAWNLIVGARPGQDGTLRFTRSRCRHCHGKKFTHRNPGHNLRMTGHVSICGDCRGTGRGQASNARALPAVVTETDREEA